MKHASIPVGRLFRPLRPVTPSMPPPCPFRGDGGKGQLGLASKDTVRYYASAAPTTSTCCNNFVLDPSIHFVDEARARCDFEDRNRNISDQYIRSRPTLVSQAGQQWALVSAGAEHTCGISGGVSLLCWGESLPGCPQCDLYVIGVGRLHL